MGPFTAKDQILVIYIFCFEWVGIYVVFCIAVEEAPKLDSNAKAGGGQDAEVAYLHFDNPFVKLLSFLNSHVFIYSLAVNRSSFKTWELEICRRRKLLMPAKLKGAFYFFRSLSHSVTRVILVLSLVFVVGWSLWL